MGPASGNFYPSLVVMAGMSLGVHSFVESSDRPRLPKSRAVWQGTLTLAVRNALAFGGNVYAEDEIHGASVNHEELFSCTFSCLRICVRNIERWKDFKIEHWVFYVLSREFSQITLSSPLCIEEVRSEANWSPCGLFLNTSFDHMFFCWPLCWESCAF